MAENQQIGILETREDTFIQDVASRLGMVDFVSFREETLTPSKRFRVILDRASYRYPYLREMLKAWSLDGCYVLNNPFAASMTNKLIDLHLSHHLQIPVPKTLVLPDLTVREEFPDSVSEPSWERVSEEIGFPCILKPFDGYGWTDVFVVHDIAELRNLYNPASYKRILLVQQLIQYTHYYRAFCIGQKEVFFSQWIPRPLGAGEYSLYDPKPLEHVKEKLIEMTAELNTSLDLDFNALEWCLDREGKPWLIDAFNEVPDIPKQKLPDECYWWIVERLVACIQDKLQNPEKHNRVSFRPHQFTAAGE